MIRLLIIALIVLSASPLNAQSFTGLDLNGACTGKDQEAQHTCAIWISGFQAGVLMARIAAEATQDRVCLPDGFTGEQARLIVEKFMRDNPAVLHKSATVVAMSALFEAFPCKVENPN
jgi:hypothetical protein